MRRKYAVSYIDKLLDEGDVQELVGCLSSHASFNRGALEYELPRPAFVIIETLHWSSSARSGAWQYYEALPRGRFEYLCAELGTLAPQDFGDWYARGAQDWQNEEAMAQLDDWLTSHQSRIWAWIADYARHNRDLVLRLTAV